MFQRFLSASISAADFLQAWSWSSAAESVRIGDGRSAGTGVYLTVHEDFEQRPAPIRTFSVVLEQFQVVGDAGFEPATSAMSRQRSNQLS